MYPKRDCFLQPTVYLVIRLHEQHAQQCKLLLGTRKFPGDSQQLATQHIPVIRHLRRSIAVKLLCSLCLLQLFEMAVLLLGANDMLFTHDSLHSLHFDLRVLQFDATAPDLLVLRSDEVESIGV